jgi:hypothetical protein
METKQLALRMRESPKMGTSRFIRRWQNRILNFPYHGMIYFLQLWVALVVIWTIHLRLLYVLISKAGASPPDTVKE